MCLIVFANNLHSNYRLILGANRDEYHERPADPARFWPDAPLLLAGRDRQAGGTWLGVTIDGRFAALTNYRDPRPQVDDPPSRGRLVTEFLAGGDTDLFGFQAMLQRERERYDGFNLLYGTIDDLHYFTNRGGSSGPVPPGVHALSNHLLDSRWPKSCAARARLEAILGNATIDPDQIIAALADPAPFADRLLPDTGIGLERERLLSPLFIAGSEYGTRSTTVLLVERSGRVNFRERAFDNRQRTVSDQSFSFQLTAA